MSNPKRTERAAFGHVLLHRFVRLFRLFEITVAIPRTDGPATVSRLACGECQWVPEGNDEALYENWWGTFRRVPACDFPKNEHGLHS